MDVWYGLPCSLAVLEICVDEFRAAESSLGLPDTLR